MHMSCINHELMWLHNSQGDNFLTLEKAPLGIMGDLLYRHNDMNSGAKSWHVYIFYLFSKQHFFYTLIRWDDFY